MSRSPRTLLAAFVFVTLGSPAATVSRAGVPEGETITGEVLNPATYGPAVIETLEAAVARDQHTERPAPRVEFGAWVIPTAAAMSAPCSGGKHVTNRFGEPRLGIGFPIPVDVLGAYFAGQEDPSVWAAGVKVEGYRAGTLVAETAWLSPLRDEPTWLAMNFEDVDRIIVVAEPVRNGAGWYAMDDLTFAPLDRPDEVFVADFEDVPYKANLAQTDYFGLTWESGSPRRRTDDIVPAPAVVPQGQATDPQAHPDDSMATAGTRAVTPTLLQSFQGIIRGDAGQFSAPPDTCGAVGPSHYVIAVNRNFAVYNKATGARVLSLGLGSFQPGTSGDPRVLYDQFAGRWIVISSDFEARVYLAYSLTSDPTGQWYKTSILVADGADALRWPDYPTLGVDANGIYISAYMVGGPGMSIFAVDKAPLLAATPSLGTVTAFRSLSEDTIQPCHTFGTPGQEYLICRRSSTSLRIYRVNPPLTSPTLTNVGNVTIPTHSAPPDAAALGSTTPLDTVGHRLMMALYRDGHIWTTHTVSVGGRAAVRWYQVQPSPLALIQSGTVSSTTRHYFFPAIMVNTSGGAVLGFSGSSSTEYAGCYYAGRRASDPPGEMSAPVQYKAGVGPQNIIDSYGRNRFGDYSLTTLDPADGVTFWTLQEYGHSTDVWGTYVAKLSLGDGDCNNNGVPDGTDISNGTSQDCNGNGTPDECDISGGFSTDCNGNGVPPAMSQLSGTPDCNGNSVPDSCDIAGGTPDCNGNSVPDSCDIAGGTPDCDGNGAPDTCDLAGGAAYDCNGNNVPDGCDITASTSTDCNANAVPDDCELTLPQGLAGAYYANSDFTDRLVGRIDTTVNFDWATGEPLATLGADTFSVRWTGFVRTLAAGTYTFYVRSDDGTRLYIANTPVVDAWQDQSATEHSGTIELPADAEVPITLEYYENTGAALIELRWQPPGGAKAILPAAHLRPGRDCNNNGGLDACDFAAAYEVSSPTLTPLGGAAQVHTFTALPPAVGDVTFTFVAQGDLTFANEYVTASADGVGLGDLFVTAFACIADQTETRTLSAAAFNAIAGDGNVAVTMTPTAAVNPASCNGNTWIRVQLSYAAQAAVDANNNGIPDACEAPPPCLGDMNCDGIVNFADIDPFVTALGGPTAYDTLFPHCRWLNADVNSDGNVTFKDIDPFVNRLGATCP